MDGGSELSDVEDVYVNEEADCLNAFVVIYGLPKRRWSYTINPTCLTAAGAPTACEAKRGEVTIGGGRGGCEVNSQ